MPSTDRQDRIEHRDRPRGVRRRRWAATAAGVCALLLISHAGPAGTPAAEASVLDNIFYKILGLTIVWGADSGGTAPVVSDFVLMTTPSGTAGSDITPGDVHTVLTGTLDPVPVSAASDEGYPLEIVNQTSGGVFTDDGDGVLDAGDSLTAFGIDETTDLELDVSTQSRSFYVASNTAFDISATAAISTNSLGAALSDIDFFCDPVTLAGTDGTISFGGNSQDPSVGGSGFTCPADLGALGGGSIIYDGGQATAASVGTIATQSVRFNFRYDFTYDLAMGTGDLDVDVTYTIFVP